MPAIADITVKKNDGTTDIVYNAVSPSAGDTVAAVYRQDTASTLPPGMRPSLRVKSRNNGTGTARNIDVRYVYPFTYVDSATGRTMSQDVELFTGSFIIPQHLPQITTDEFVSQCVNLLGSAHMKACLKAGYAAT